jgi:hypothetical protein
MMSTVELINQHVQRLPEPFLNEVLHFIEFLMKKIVPENSRQDELQWSRFSLAEAMMLRLQSRLQEFGLQWSRFSLAEAMRGLEDENGPIYGESDLKERWK